MLTRKHDGIRLYNVLFPVWVLILIPQVWLVVLPANFIIDSLVLILAMKFLHVAEPKPVWKSSILKVWCFGFAADIISGFALTGAILLLNLLSWDITLPSYIWMEALIALPAVLLSGILIYVFNKHFAFGKTALSLEEKHKLALALAVFTAPYTFMIPLSWIY